MYLDQQTENEISEQNPRSLRRETTKIWKNMDREGDGRPTDFVNQIVEELITKRGARVSKRRE